MRKLSRWIIRLVIAVTVFVAASNLWIIASTYKKVYSSSAEVPTKAVALVLGTTDRLKSGKENPYFIGRIKSAATLYKENKISHIILSGDNRTKYYNEPLKMQEALLKEGVPIDAITLDFAGLRTLDSVVRCQKIFGQDNIIIVTQQFHGYRALFISNFYQLDAVVMSAADVSFPDSLPTRLREIIARPLAVIDLYLLNRQPHLLGEKEYL